MVNGLAGYRRYYTAVMAAAACLIVLGWLAEVVRADSLFTPKAEYRGSMFADEKVRFSVGDMITVLISETTSAKAQAKTDTSKDSELEAEASSEFLTSPLGFNLIGEKKLPDWKFKAENEFEGGGTTSRSTKFTSTITVFVTRILDNGNLEVHGEKEILVNRERSKLVLRGVIRARDVAAENTIFSSQIGGLRMHFEGQGPIWNSQRRGFFMKLLDWIFPF